MYKGIQWGILEHPGVYLAGALINWQDIIKCISVARGTYWNTHAFIWQDHRLTGRISMNVYGYPVGHIGTPKRLIEKSPN